MKREHNCAHEYEQEQIEAEQRERHDAGDCEGPPICPYCLDAQRVGEESLGG